MKRILLCFLLCCVLTDMSAQQRNQARFTPERFQAQLEQYIAKKACLTPKESAEFFPVYAEMRRKQRFIHNEMKTLKRIKPTTNAECEKNVIKRDELEIEIKELQKEYHKKFMQILSAKKVYDVLKAEDRFHRQMFKRAANNKRRKK